TPSPEPPTAPIGWVRGVGSPSLVAGLFFELVLHDLAGFVVGEGVAELDVGGDLVGREGLGDPALDVGRGDVAAGTGDDEGLHVLAQLLVVDAAHRGRSE